VEWFVKFLYLKKLSETSVFYMYNFVTGGITTEISMYKLAVAVDQHVSVQKAGTAEKIRKHRWKCVGKR
jgi:hypothetical protein